MGWGGRPGTEHETNDERGVGDLPGEVWGGDEAAVASVAERKHQHLEGLLIKARTYARTHAPPHRESERGRGRRRE